MPAGGGNNDSGGANKGDYTDIGTTSTDPYANDPGTYLDVTGLPPDLLAFMAYGGNPGAPDEGINSFEGPTWGDTGEFDNIMAVATQVAQAVAAGYLIGPAFAAMGPIAGGAATGATVGAGEAGLTGGNIERGAEIGAVGGAAGGAVSSNLSGATPAENAALSGAASHVASTVAGTYLNSNPSSGSGSPNGNSMINPNNPGGTMMAPGYTPPFSGLTGSTVGSMGSQVGGLAGATVRSLGSANSPIAKGFV